MGIAPFPDDSEGSGSVTARADAPCPATHSSWPLCQRACTNADLSRLYQHLTEKGKPHKVAVVAVMRKLGILANVLVREDASGRRSAPATIGG